MSWDDLVDSWAGMFGKRDLVTREECAVFLGYSRQTVDRWIDEGKIKIICVGKRVMLHKRDVLGMVTF